MGLLMNLPKQDNVLYIDFNNAYWSIDSIIFSNGSDGINYCTFTFNAYGSREAKLMNLTPIELTLQFGGPIGIAYTPKLHQWEGSFKSTDLFPTGIPVNESDQKDVLYMFIKSYLNLTDYTDVLE